MENFKETMKDLHFKENRVRIYILIPILIALLLITMNPDFRFEHEGLVYGFNAALMAYSGIFSLLDAFHAKALRAQGSDIVSLISQVAIMTMFWFTSTSMLASVGLGIWAVVFVLIIIALTTTWKFIFLGNLYTALKSRAIKILSFVVITIIHLVAISFVFALIYEANPSVFPEFPRIFGGANTYSWGFLAYMILRSASPLFGNIESVYVVYNTDSWLHILPYAQQVYGLVYQAFLIVTTFKLLTTKENNKDDDDLNMAISHPRYFR